MYPFFIPVLYNQLATTTLNKFSYKKQILVLILGGLIAILSSFFLPAIKGDPLRYQRVKTAYAEKELIILTLLRKNNFGKAKNYLKENMISPESPTEKETLVHRCSL